MKIVLASSSGRRIKLLKRIARKFRITPAYVDERIAPGEAFSSAAVRLADKKAKKVAKKHKNAIVIGADTIAYQGKIIYRKTENKKNARKILLGLSGKKHFVVTGVAVVYPNGKCTSYSVKAAVKMKKLSGKTVEKYLETGEWRGRAGCYDVSGKGRRLVESIKGERETVVGLPLLRLKKLLRS